MLRTLYSELEQARKSAAFNRQQYLEDRGAIKVLLRLIAEMEATDE